MDWFFKLIRSVGASFPVSSSLVQFQAEIDSEKINNHLENLEDPISQLHEDIHPISEIIYEEIKKTGEKHLKFSAEFYQKYSKVLAVLETEGMITVSHSPTEENYFNGFRVIDPTYILYIARKFDDQDKMAKLCDEVESCQPGERLDGNEIQKEVDVPLPVIKAVFDIYESKGYGFCSNDGSVKYLGRA